MLRLKSDNSLMVGEGVSGSNQGVLSSSFLRVMSLVMMVSIGMSCFFGGKGFSLFGILAYKYGFQNKQGFTWFIGENSVFKGLVCVFLSD